LGGNSLLGFARLAFFSRFGVFSGIGLICSPSYSWCPLDQPDPKPSSQVQNLRRRASICLQQRGWTVKYLQNR
jgi:hypothetical protein